MFSVGFTIFNQSGYGVSFRSIQCLIHIKIFYPFKYMKKILESNISFHFDRVRISPNPEIVEDSHALPATLLFNLGNYLEILQILF